jgi:hypothetical protein
MFGLGLGIAGGGRGRGVPVTPDPLFIGCADPAYANNIRAWNDTDEVTSVPSTSSVAEFVVPTPTGAVQISVGQFAQSFTENSTPISIEVGNFHGKENVLKVTVPGSWIYSNYTISIFQTLYYYGNTEFVNYGLFRDAVDTYNYNLSASLRVSRRGNPAASDGTFGMGPGPTGFIANGLAVPPLNENEWVDFEQLSHPFTDPSDATTTRMGLTVPTSEDFPYGPSGGLSPDYFMPGFELYIASWQMSICNETDSVSLDSSQDRIVTDGASNYDQFAGVPFSFAQSTGNIWTPSYGSPHTWVPGEVGYKGLQVSGFTSGQWGTGPAPATSFYGITELPSGFAGVTDQVLRFENRIGFQAERGFRLKLGPKDEDQVRIDFSPFINNPEWRHTIRVKFYIETPSGVTYRDVSGINTAVYPDVGLRWAFGTSGADIVHADNITRLNQSSYPLNQWNTLVINNKFFQGQETGDLGTFLLAAEYVMPGTTDDGTYATSADSEVNLYIAELSWNISDGTDLGYSYA